MRSLIQIKSAIHGSASCRLEQLYDVARRVLEQDLLTAGAGHDFVAESRPGVAKLSHLGVDVVDKK